MRVWFNRHFALVARILPLLREIGSDLSITALVSHRHADFAGYAAADEWFLEPQGLSCEDYVQWCLDTAVARRVDWLIPGHEASALAAATELFSAKGIRLLNAAEPDVLPRLHQKDWVYAQCPQGIPLPRCELVRDDASLAQAIATIERAGPACIKPTVSIYGKGFHRITSCSSTAEADVLTIGGWHALHGEVTASKPQMVLQYLPQHEYSVDVACFHGEVLAGVVRRKPLTATWRTLEDRPDLLAYSAQLVERFALNGLVNIQFKDDENHVPHLLEINPRASGGIGMSCVSGINLPAIAYSACIADGRRLQVPPARLGIRVTEIPMAFVLPEAHL